MDRQVEPTVKHNNGAAERWSPRKIINATLVVLAVMAGFALVFRFQTVFFSLFSAIVLGIAIRPAVDWLTRRGLPRGVSAGIVFVLLLGLIVTLFMLLAPLISEQGTRITYTLTGYYRSFVDALRMSESYLVRRLALQLPLVIETPLPGATAEESINFNQVQTLFSFVGLILRAVFVTIAVLLLTFYWTLEGERATRSVVLFFPAERRDTARSFIAAIEEKLGAYIRGLLILSLTVGAASLIAYLLIGMPQAVLLALLAGLFEAVPLVGPLLGALPAVFLALALDPSKLIWIIVATLIIQQAENNLLVPRIMNQTVGVNPVVSLLSLAAFGTLFGIGGALLAIPFAVVIQLAIETFIFNRTEPGPDVIPGRSEVSALRYETQELIQDIHKQVREKEEVSNREADALEDSIESLALDLDLMLAGLEDNGEEKVT